ncbi:MAG: ATP-binding protein [Alteromonadaceae bacterium]|nr:MAG: ATP-binding protein [Alteromonadaceae bacterium]
MFRFFLPASKVQKDRRIMRETDTRMAKYSRRGLMFNIIAYSVCLLYGEFVTQNRDLAIILTVGLLFSTVLRGYYLFRFEHLYPRAPGRWRNHYFVATLIGAFWWGVILFSITVKTKMGDVAPLLWLYTVVFFSSTAHAFAPYQKFLSYYQFFGIVPAAVAAFYIQTFYGYVYGSIIFFFYMALAHECRLISENYWEKLEASYALVRKTLSVEEEKRDTHADVLLSKEFLKHLYADLNNVMRVFEGGVPAAALTEQSEDFRQDFSKLSRNIGDFYGVLSKELVLSDEVFNIRHEIQHLVAEFIDDAESVGVQIETALSATLPMRLKGDAARIAQIIRVLLTIVLRDVRNSIVLVEVEFLREYEAAGELYVTVGRSVKAGVKKRFSSEVKQSKPKEDLSLIVAKGLSDLMDGSVEYSESVDNEQRFRFNAKVDVAEISGQLDYHRNYFAGKSVLLIHNSPRIVDIKRQELDALGFNVYTETKYSRAIQNLLDSYKFQAPIGSLIYYYEPNDDSVFEFSQSLVDNRDLQFVKKFISATRKQQNDLRARGFDEKSGFHFIDKPTGLFELETVFRAVLTDFDEDLQFKQDEALKKVSLIFYTQPEQCSERLLKEVKSSLYQVTIVSSMAELLNFTSGEWQELVLFDCDTTEDIRGLIDMLRHHESSQHMDTFRPVIGVCTSKDEMEEFAYELGLDDFVDMTNNTKKTLRSTIEYWSSLG